MVYGLVCLSPQSESNGLDDWTETDGLSPLDGNWWFVSSGCNRWLVGLDDWTDRMELVVCRFVSSVCLLWSVGQCPLKD